MSIAFFDTSSKEFYALRLYDICTNSHNFYTILCCTIALFTILILLREDDQGHSSVYLAANAQTKKKHTIGQRIKSLKVFLFYGTLYNAIWKYTENKV